MYKVYQDPEGKQCLDQKCFSNKFISTNENDEVYKRRIEGLNEEIKVLNEKLQMVIPI